MGLDKIGRQAEGFSGREIAKMFSPFKRTSTALSVAIMMQTISPGAECLDHVVQSIVAQHENLASFDQTTAAALRRPNFAAGMNKKGTTKGRKAHCNNTATPDRRKRSATLRYN